MSQDSNGNEQRSDSQRADAKQPTQSGNDDVRREVDRLARQMGRIGDELKKLRDRV